MGAFLVNRFVFMDGFSSDLPRAISLVTPHHSRLVDLLPLIETCDHTKLANNMNTCSSKI